MAERDDADLDVTTGAPRVAQASLEEAARGPEFVKHPWLVADGPLFDQEEREEEWAEREAPYPLDVATAEEFLLAALAAGPRPRAELMEAAAVLGITPAELRVARGWLGVEKWREGPRHILGLPATIDPQAP